MGLLLSILVTCVGVVELLDLCRNVKRRVTYHPVPGSSLASIHHQHLKELEGIRDRLDEQLKQYPTLRLNSHEDIDVEFDDRVIIAKSRSPSPRRFLATEKVNSTSQDATRHFLLSEEPQALRKSKAQECLPEFLIEEKIQPGIPRYVLKDEDDGPVNLPLPEKFVVSEHEPRSNDVFRRKLGHTVMEVDGELFYRRSPSPFPSFDLTAPRNSVCSELLDDSTVTEVDEKSRSTSPVTAELNNEINNNDSEKVNILLSTTNQTHSSTDYWDNKLAVPKKKSKSRSPSPGLRKLDKDRRRSLSESNTADFGEKVNLSAKTASNLELCKNEDASSSDDNNEEFMEVETFTEEMKNSLDGVDKKKGCIKKKLVKRKRIKNRPKKSLDHEVAAAGTSEPKPGEPFWVNR